MQLWKDSLRQQCMRVEPVHACLCACDVRRGRDRTKNDNHSSSSDLDSHVCTQRRLKLYMELYMLGTRSEQGVKTDEEVTGGYAEQVATYMPVRKYVCMSVGCM